MKFDLLMVVDMQNDFIDGRLGSEEAEKIVPNVVDIIKSFKEKNIPVVATVDTHYENNYIRSREGEHLPIRHCIYQTGGWCIEDRVMRALNEKTGLTSFIEKVDTFGSVDVAELFEPGFSGNFVVVGLCTDLCVLANTVILQAGHPNAEIYIVEDACAGSTPERHSATLDVLSNMHVNVISTNDLLDLMKSTPDADNME